MITLREEIEKILLGSFIHGSAYMFDSRALFKKEVEEAADRLLRAFEERETKRNQLIASLVTELITTKSTLNLQKLHDRYVITDPYKKRPKKNSTPEIEAEAHKEAAQELEKLYRDFGLEDEF